METLDDILRRVTVTPDGCWEWQGGRSQQGYGLARWFGRKGAVHRIVYEQMVASIPAGLLACHRCDNPPCCNPEHIFLGTQADNMNDMYAKGRRYPEGPKKTICKRGHARSGANLRGATCIECQNIVRRAWRAKRREMGLPPA